MPNVRVNNRRVVGVDFSGARDAGNRIWVAEGEFGSDGARIAACRRARDLAGGAVAREAALGALVHHIAGSGDAFVGLDFPFGLPSPLVVEPDWEAFVRAFPRRYPTAESFRVSCRSVTGGKEIKRLTDVEARVPFGVFNLRLFRQTHAGIATVLHPLVSSDRARAVPMQSAAAGKPVLVEACPASLLKSEGLYGSYKGRAGALRDARRSIVEALVERKILAPLPHSIRSEVLNDPGGDALDSVIAAICAVRAANDASARAVRNPSEAIEARVFF